MVEPIPLPTGERILTGAGAYSEITKISAPSEAAPGNTVTISITIKNLYSSTIGIMVGGALEYGVTPWPKISCPDNHLNVPGGESHTFQCTFTMPEYDVIIHAYSYYYSSDGWVFDDERTKDIDVGTEPEFSNLQATFRKVT
jgi:hypothetical protein